MTPRQRATVDRLVREGFSVVLEAREIVRVTRNGDHRVIMRDGSEKRGHHVDPAQGGRSSSRRG